MAHPHLLCCPVGAGGLETPLVGRRASPLTHGLLQEVPRLLLLLGGPVQPVLQLGQLSRAFPAFPATLAASTCTSLAKATERQWDTHIKETVDQR